MVDQPLPSDPLHPLLEEHQSTSVIVPTVTQVISADARAERQRFQTTLEHSRREDLVIPENHDAGAGFAETPQLSAKPVSVLHQSPQGLRSGSRVRPPESIR